MERTIQELHKIIQAQQAEINDLRDKYNKLKEWSDLNDFWLRDMIDALTDSVDKLYEERAKGK